MAWIKKFLFVIILLCLSENFAYARNIYVRLSNSGRYAISTTKGNLIMTDAENRVANLTDEVVVHVKNGKAHISDNDFNLPVEFSSSEGLLKFDGRAYRGTFLISTREALLNIVELENYLCGVLPAEVGSSWHAEALRAQAIIARTYVLHRSMTRSERGYDVVDTDMDQVYKGASVETSKTNRAVSSTRGQIVTYGHEIAFTPFHSDSGGHTASNYDVWGKEFEYLKGVPEVVEYTSPVSSWNVKIKASKIQSAVKKITGHDIGTIKEIQVSDIDQGGRAINLTINGSKGTETIKASTFRLNIDPRSLKSTMLTPSGGNYSPKNTSTPSGLVAQHEQIDVSDLGMSLSMEQDLAKMTADGIFTTTELIDMLTNPDTQKKYYEVGIERTGRAKNSSDQNSNDELKKVKPRNNYGFSIEKSGKNFIFYGRGWGHGVGLCQWGMLEMARQGWTAEKILEHYYPGTSVRRIK